MTLGLLNLPYQSIVLPYNDELTPVKLTGAKMLPIMMIDGKAMNESLDIMAALDSGNRLKIKDTVNSPEFQEFNHLLNKLGKNVHNLAMPYWIYTPEFNEESRKYFQEKKEIKRGPFKILVHNRQKFEEEILRDLNDLTQNLRPFFHSGSFGVYDILLAAHIWGLYVVPEFQFPEKIHQYLMKVKDTCYFNYHQDFWS
jgi:glutaredoxin 2